MEEEEGVDEAEGVGGFTRAAIGGGIKAWTVPEATEADLKREAADKEADEGIGGSAAAPDGGEDEEDMEEDKVGGLGRWEGTAKGTAATGMLGSAELERGIEAGTGEGEEEGGVEMERPAATAAFAWATELVPLTDLPFPLNEDDDNP